MNKLKLAKTYIKEYLEVVSRYAEDFFPLYLDRVNIKKIDGFEYSPHGCGIFIEDTKNNIEIDFDYFYYKGDGIKYFDFWRVNKFIIHQGKVDEITEETWEALEARGYIKKYFKSNYYYII